MIISDPAIMDLSSITQYFPELTDEQKRKFSLLPDIYAEWNSKINVISRKDMDSFMIHHVLHSLAIARFISFKPGSSVLDIGTGGGFPGIPLAIMFPEALFYLVDSIGKKIKVVNEVIAALDLNNVTAENIRAEQVNQSFDFIVSRAVAPAVSLYSWTIHKVKKKSFNEMKNGYIFLKGGDLTDELKDFPKAKEIPLSTYFKEDFFETKKIVYIPKTDKR